MARASSALYQRRQPCRNHLKGLDTHRHTLNVRTLCRLIIPEVNLAKMLKCEKPFKFSPRRENHFTHLISHI